MWCGCCCRGVRTLGHTTSYRGESACQAASRMGWLVDTDVMPQLCGEFGIWLTENFWRDATSIDVQRELDAGAEVNIRDGRGETPLHKAVLSNSTPSVVELLLDRGADVDAAEGHFGWRPLHMAARKGNSVVVALLLEWGADLHAKGGHGFTPLHLASEFASDEAGLETVRLLLDRGADIRARNDLGEPPLFRSVHSYVDDYPATTALLLERGADPTARDVDGFTPLHRGVSSLKALPAVVELLLEYGADAVARSDSGLTPLDMAQRHSAPPGVVQVLVDRKYRPDTEPTGTPGR